MLYRAALKDVLEENYETDQDREHLLRDIFTYLEAFT